MIIRDKVLGDWHIDARWKTFNVYFKDVPKVEHSSDTLNDAVVYIFNKRLAQITDTVTIQQYNQKIKELDNEFQAAYQLKEEPAIVEKYKPMIPIPEQGVGEMVKNEEKQ